jgi:signal recognition particle subunit SEC65
MESEDKISKTWIKVYPSYLDKELKHSDGRKVALPYAVEKPIAQEIFLVCTNILKLNCKVEYVNISSYSIITRKIG